MNDIGKKVNTKKKKKKIPIKKNFQYKKKKLGNI